MALYWAAVIIKHVLLGISGGIAAYKAVELLRLLRKQGLEVRVVLTQAGNQFVAPLTLQALSGHPVHSELLDANQEQSMSHIHLARWADVIVIAPATAHCLAKLAHGLADDLLSTLCLAAQCPIYLAPAMNQAMWAKTVTQANVQVLKQMGMRIIDPEVGEQACGDTGMGRMAEPETICAALLTAFEPLLKGYRVLITAGPTREPLDPVRYISNRSSGKMGYALAQAALDMGAEVTLVSGVVVLTAPEPTRLVKVETARQMFDAVMAEAGCFDIYIGAAAVADYRPKHIHNEKLKKQGEDSVIALERTEDIVASVAELSPKPFVVGFAAETQQLEQYALDKMHRKNMDMIAANWVGGEQGGFDSDQNALAVFWAGGQTHLAMTDKLQLARQLIALIAEKFNENHTIKNT